MASINNEVVLEVPPYLRIFKDGTLERLAGNQFIPACLHPQTGVLSKDIVIIPDTGVSVRLYRPNLIKSGQKLAIIVYFHGGAFCISSVGDPFYHNLLNILVAEANIILVSVGYRRAPEHPLPAAYEDSWAALQWVASQGGLHEQDTWLKEFADLDRLFLAGDSAGANIAHHMALRFKQLSDPTTTKLKIVGIALIHPYFWGKEPIGMEVQDPIRKAMVDKWWMFVCPSEKGCDDYLINPFVDGELGLEGLACDRVLILVAEKDILKDRGWLYHENLVKSRWRGTAEIVETEGEDHVFHMFNPTSEKAKSLLKRLASFVSQGPSCYV